MYSRLYEFFKRLLFLRREPDLQGITTSDSPVHTLADDDLDTCPNSLVDILDDGQEWVDLSVIDAMGNKEPIKQEEPVKSSESPPKVTFTEPIVKKPVIVTEQKKKRKKKR